MITTKDICWLAGLLEGEGAFLSRDNGQPRIALDTTDKDVAEKAARLMGDAPVSLRAPYVLRSGNQAKQVYIVRPRIVPSASWMMTIYPLMGERRQRQISAVLKAWRERPVAFTDNEGKQYRVWPKTHWGNRTQCAKGHALTPDNIMPANRTGRRCKTCARTYWNEWARKKRASLKIHPISAIDILSK